MPKASPIQANFNAGELSPTLEGRVDIAWYGNGCHKLRNFIPLVQGPARRRSGTRYVAEVKNSTQRTWLVPFKFSDDVAFVLEFGNLYIRFYTQHGQVVTGGPPVPLEVVTPWTTADLTAADGTFRLSMVQSADVIYIAHPDYPLRKLIRVSNTNWTLGAVDIKGGPFQVVDPDQTVTVYASAATGTGITLTASSAIFTADKVGSLILLESKPTDDVRAWEVAKSITAGNERRSDGNVYSANNTATTGSVKPTHTTGARYDGDTGVQWQYLHSGWGYAKITAVGGGGTTATADVVRRIPSQAVGVGNPTNRWAFSEWSTDLGWPSHVAFFRERLWLGRGTKLWASVVADFENFSSRDGADVTPDMAISIDIASDQINDLAWMAAGDALLLGTVGNEFAVGEVSGGEPIGPANIQAKQQTSHGSRQVQPVRVNDAVLFVQRAGRKLREIRFTFESEGYATNDVSLRAEHITRGQIVQLTYQQEPHSIVWACCANGDLLGFTYNREQDVQGWHPHPIGGGAVVESVASIPSPDGTRDELWIIARRTINGVTRRYVEWMERDWISYEGSTIDEAFFVDAGGTFNGAQPSITLTLSRVSGDFVTASASVFSAGDVGDEIILRRGTPDQVRFVIDSYVSATQVGIRPRTSFPSYFDSTGETEVGFYFGRDVISGLGYLEGQSVDVLVDGAVHPARTVASGQITLERFGAVVNVGLNFTATLVTGRLEAGASDGTAQGKTKRVHKVRYRLLDTLGGKGGTTEASLERMQFRVASDPMGSPPAVFTGDIDLLIPSGYEKDARIVYINDQPLPATVVAIMPQVVTND